MSKVGKRSREANNYESDDGFVSNDDGKAPKSKKTKKEKKSSKGEDEGANSFWALSTGRTPRRVEITEFKNMKLINIREFYEKDDAYLPGKKGISLTVDQYKAFLEAIPEINARLKDAGVDVGGHAADNDDESDSAVRQKRKTKSKNDKSNIDATSDEDE